MQVSVLFSINDFRCPIRFFQIHGGMINGTRLLACRSFRLRTCARGEHRGKEGQDINMLDSIFGRRKANMIMLVREGRLDDIADGI